MPLGQAVRSRVWASSGKELFYWEGNKLISATLSFGPQPAVVSRTPLFAGRYADDYDVSNDGKRFLMVEPESSGLELVVVPSWRSELKRVTAGKKP